jgi:twinkle protein
MDVREYLFQKGFDWREKRRATGNEAVMICPFCKDKEKKFSINLESGAFNCLRLNNCGVKGSFWEFQKMLGDQPKKLNDIYQNKIIKPQIKKNYSIPKKENLKNPNNKIIEYFKGRKISEKTINYFKIVQDKSGAIAFPYFKYGQLVNIKYRSIKEKKFWNEKNTESTLFNMDNIKGEMLFITEGEIDCLSMHEYGIPAASLPNGVNNLDWIDNLWEWLDKFKIIILIFDMDQAGKDAALKISKRLGIWRCRGVNLPEKDINDCLKKGIDITKYISDPIDFKNPKIKNAKDYSQDIKNLIKDKNNLYGIEIGFNGLQNILKGWRLQEWTVWTGRNSSGKTNMINQIILDLIDKKQKCCLISLEMKPKRILRWAIMQKSRTKYIDDEKIDEVLNWMDGHLYFLDVQGIINQVELLDMFEFCNRRYGVNHFFIDNLIGIKMDSKNELNEQKDFAKRINAFTQDFNCHVHLVAHPRKGLKDTDRPDKVDISGTGDISNLAYNVIVIYRPTEEEKERAKNKNIDLPDTILFVKKNREWGIEGKVNFHFDEDSKYFIEIK